MPQAKCFGPGELVAGMPGSFPCGVNQGETPEQALYRELHEEVGLRAASVHC